MSTAQLGLSHVLGRAWDVYTPSFGWAMVATFLPLACFVIAPPIGWFVGLYFMLGGLRVLLRLNRGQAVSADDLVSTPLPQFARGGLAALVSMGAVGLAVFCSAPMLIAFGFAQQSWLGGGVAAVMAFAVVGAAVAIASVLPLYVYMALVDGAESLSDAVGRVGDLFHGRWAEVILSDVGLAFGALLFGLCTLGAAVFLLPPIMMLFGAVQYTLLCEQAAHAESA